ncbi:lipoprotein-anchoring transpeptidase ErfK/SrfK [Aeromicrobium sp. SORGH_AS981]|uniref:L,D-transpeptidase n=1 Tax=Aeromicrobium sp. SORGH_AS_0981 TaxID=3041802 RepID=UPI00285E5BE4|nr:Ig-like domain-containing protein [Aeromicrobium sp. SORGH_AS_0981]MDR6119146.1 lipoprotein-anchoring transpeptidase ErfK/SrfK [Aeromicrobium sp. SORGH_AS_0981]
MSTTNRSLRLLVGAVLLVTLGACTAARSEQPSASPTQQPATVSANVEDQASDVPVDTVVSVEVQHGTVTEASLTSSDGKQVVKGEGGDGRWAATSRLEPGTAYTLTAQAEGTDGKPAKLVRTFTTRALTLDQQTYPAVAPLANETVGVGMPVIVTFDVPVENKKLFEQHMHVTSTPKVEGAWHWMSDTVVHYRPKEFWPAGTKVSVDLDLNSLPAGNGVYGQQDQHVPFTVGRRIVSTVDVARHTLTMNVDGRDVRTIPVSTGKPGHETRGGTKVIMEKFASVDMDAASTGVSESDPDYYDISDVRWAMRVTNSGEFLHAAPWSVGSQGRENVSHGCVGMSTADAQWIYDQSRRGDVVKFVNSGRSLEQNNGWTDWNTRWSDWVQGSALKRAS